MKRRIPILLAAAALATVTGRAQAPRPFSLDDYRDQIRVASTRFNVVEATIPELTAALDDGRVTSRELVLIYLSRIAQYENTLNASIAVNAQAALAEADQMDLERSQHNLRGALHGIPIALKDIIHTTTMPTTGGALALKDYTPPYEATLTTNLRRAGAIIIAKTVLTELANWVAGAPTPMPANYSAVGGYGMNPYDPRPDPREGFSDGRPAMATGGSSSGIGTAANLWAASVGTETSGSILSPSNQNMLVGIKPTVGLISRYGIAPITGDQDTAGPMTRTVTDAAILLGVLKGREADARDRATGVCPPPIGHDYTNYLKLSGLRGKRIGIPRAFYYNAITPPGGTAPTGGLNAAQAASMNDAIAILRREGAVIVDPADIPSIVDGTPDRNFLNFPVCSGASNAKGQDANCSVVFKYGMKRDFNAWLATLGPTAPVKTLTELRAFNTANAARGAIKYGQSQLDISDEMDLVADKARYEADRAKDLVLSATHGIGEVMNVNKLDALLFPGSSSAAIAAKPGYPTVIVPFGMVPNAPSPAFPAGFNAKDQPYGVSFTSTSCNEPTLLEIAYAFEQATKKRVPPAAAP